MNITVDEIYNRLTDIDQLLNDMFISWFRTKQLLEERAKLVKKLQELNIEP